jgi:hypothetical protein
MGAGAPGGAQVHRSRITGQAADIIEYRVSFSRRTSALADARREYGID